MGPPLLDTMAKWIGRAGRYGGTMPIGGIGAKRCPRFVSVASDAMVMLPEGLRALVALHLPQNYCTPR